MGQARGPARILPGLKSGGCWISPGRASLLCDLPLTLTFTLEVIALSLLAFVGEARTTNRKKHCTPKTLGEAFGLMCAPICLSQGTITNKTLNYMETSEPTQTRAETADSRINGLEASDLQL